MGYGATPFSKEYYTQTVSKGPGLAQYQAPNKQVGPVGSSTDARGKPWSWSEQDWKDDQAQRAKKAEDKRLKAAAKKEEAAALTKGEKQTLYQKAKTGIMGGGVGGDPTITKKGWAETAPKGQHKLRTQYERLKAKYGPAWEKTEQAKVLGNYLSGVAVERGGGLGARDPGYGGATVNPTDPAEIYRQQLLQKMGIAGIPMEGWQEGSVADQLGGMNIDLARQGLTPDQYFNFTQQLMAADPSVGNVDYKAARKFSSGDLLGGVAQNFGPTSWIGKGIGALTRPAREAGRDLRTMVEPITSAVKPTLTDLRTDIGDMFGRPLKGLGQGIGDWFKFNPQAEYKGTEIGPDVSPDFRHTLRGRSIEPSDDPKTRYTGLGSFMGEEPWVGDRSPDEYRQQVSYGAPTTADQQSLYGGRIDHTGPVTGDWVDNDGDSVDDRYQTGPGEPYQGPAHEGLKMPGFEVGQVRQPATIMPQQSPFASSYQPFNFPISGGGQDPNFQDWYKNLGIMQNVYS